MSILGSNWLPEGYYEDDGYGYTKVEDPERIRELQREGKLFEHDGMGMGRVENNDELSITHGKYKD
jgi:hypothetical protein